MINYKSIYISFCLSPAKLIYTATFYLVFKSL